MKHVFITPVFALLFAVAAQAQNEGKLSGSVSDVTHAALPGATVTITDASTGLRQSVVTGNDGLFSVNLPAGKYKVTVKRADFETATFYKVPLTSGKPTTLDVFLQPDDRRFGYWPSVDVQRFEVAYHAASYFRESGADLLGAQASLTVNLSQRAGIVGEFSAFKEVHSPHRLQVSYTIGPRYTFMRTESRLSGFSELLTGGVRMTSKSSAAANGVVVSAGGGLDWKVKPWLAWRIVEGDYSFLRVSGDTLRGFRVSSGLVFQFGQNICPCTVTL